MKIFFFPAHSHFSRSLEFFLSRCRTPRGVRRSSGSFLRPFTLRSPLSFAYFLYLSLNTYFSSFEFAGAGLKLTFYSPKKSLN